MSQATTAGTSATPASPRVTEAPARRRITRRTLRPILMLGGIILVAIGSGAWWLTGGRYISIDNAYVRAAKETISTDISGIVLDVPVKEGQQVRKGDVLLRLNPRQFQIALDGAKANLTSVALRLKAGKLDYQRMLGDAEVKAAQVQLDQANYERMANLVKSGGVTRAEYDHARFQLAADQRALEALKIVAQVQLAKLGGDPNAEVSTMPDYQIAQAKVHEAQRQFDHTIIRAPFSGIVTQVDSVQPGMYLAASTAAFGLVSNERVWVEANPKETELTHVKPGDAVSISVDTYPGRNWSGKVETIAPNSGSEFSILPAQNTSGNWVKVVQRIPVRIQVERKPGDPELRSGMSVEAEIDTGHSRSLSDLF
jgi:membrane fusion protein (multidrug efflux system)